MPAASLLVERELGPRPLERVADVGQIAVKYAAGAVGDGELRAGRPGKPDCCRTDRRRGQLERQEALFLVDLQEGSKTAGAQPRSARELEESSPEPDDRTVSSCIAKVGRSASRLRPDSMTPGLLPRRSLKRTMVGPRTSSS